MSDINIKGELKKFPLKELSGHAKFLALSAVLSKSLVFPALSLIGVKKNWSKSFFGVKFSNTFYQRAQCEDWVVPMTDERGKFKLTEKGISECARLKGENSECNDKFKKDGALIIFNKKSAHSIDKYLRNLFKNATKNIFIADSYVDETTFDNTIDSAPKKITIKLIYGKSYNQFESREKRFKIEYLNYYSKKASYLHDRFVLIDGKGYILGPSIKDAAAKSPAIVVELGKKESAMLKLFFDEIWLDGNK